MMYPNQSLEHLRVDFLLFLKLGGLKSLGVLKFILEVVVLGLDFTQLGQCGNRIFILFNHVLALAAEEESLRVPWRHVHDLLRDSDHRLILLHLKLTDAEIGEASQLKRIQLVHALLEILTQFIFSQEVVRHITKVKVAVDLLVDLCRLCMVTKFEKFARYALEFHQDLKLARDRVLVEIRRILDAKESCCKLHSVAIFESLVLVQEVTCEISAELFIDFCRCHSCYCVLLHRLKQLLKQAGQGVSVHFEFDEGCVLE